MSQTLSDFRQRGSCRDAQRVPMCERRDCDGIRRVDAGRRWSTILCIRDAHVCRAEDMHPRIDMGHCAPWPGQELRPLTFRKFVRMCTVRTVQLIFCAVERQKAKRKNIGGLRKRHVSHKYMNLVQAWVYFLIISCVDELPRLVICLVRSSNVWDEEIKIRKRRLFVNVFHRRLTIRGMSL